MNTTLRADLHLHTDFSHPECPSIQEWTEFIDRYPTYRKRIHLLCVTEHVTPHGDRGAAKTFEAAIEQSIAFQEAMARIGVSALIGAEIETYHEDVNVYFTSEPTNTDVRALESVMETAQAARDAGAKVIQANHPLNTQGPGVPNYERNKLTQPMLAYFNQYGFEGLDSVECMNGMSQGGKLHQANILRPLLPKEVIEDIKDWNDCQPTEKKVAITGNSDAHVLGNLGRATTEFPSYSLPNPADSYVKAIRQQQTTPVAGGFRLRDLVQSGLAFIQQKTRKPATNMAV